MIGLGIILAHLVGDYILQNDWMANEKTRRWWPAVVHGFAYTFAYVLMLATAFLIHPPLGGTFLGWLLRIVGTLVIIGGTHAVIDRYRLAKNLIWFVNQFGPQGTSYPWSVAKQNAGYDAGKPAWMATWLMIIVDNTIHLLINTAAIVFILGVR